MNTSYTLLFSRNRLAKFGRTFVPALLGIISLPAFVFCGLLSVWSCSNSTTLVQAFWYGTSSTVLFGVAGFVIYGLLARAFSRPGGSSGTLPLAGAPCPVPVRPTPRLVRSAAEPLPSEKAEFRTYRSREITK